MSMSFFLTIVLAEALLAKGYREEDIEKILGGNLLRVMEATERVKADLNRQTSPDFGQARPRRRAALS